MDLCRSGGKWGKCHLPTWLCAALNLQNPACAMKARVWTLAFPAFVVCFLTMEGWEAFPVNCLLWCVKIWRGRHPPFAYSQPQQEFRGRWDLYEGDLPIIVKEALSLLFVLQRVARLVSNARVDCFVDNAPFVACWKKDCSRNARVNNVLKEILDLTLSANLHVILHFVPSEENPADYPSRVSSDLDCSLSLASWHAVQRTFGPHTVDLVATPDNVQRDLGGRALLFFAPSPSWGANVFLQVIAPSHNAYGFPPFVLVGPLIRFFASQDCPYTIVVPDLRPRKYWWPLLVSSCVDLFKLGSQGDRDILLFLADTISGMESRPLQ